MAARFSFQDQELVRVVGEVLHYIWDPIGVSGVPQGRDEYDGYVRPVFTLLTSGASDAEISDHLEQIVRTRMGLPSRQERSDEAASVLTDWRDYSTAIGA